MMCLIVIQVGAHGQNLAKSKCPVLQDYLDTIEFKATPAEAKAHAYTYYFHPNEALIIAVYKTYYSRFKHVQDTNVLKICIDLAGSYQNNLIFDTAKLYLDTCRMRFEGLDDLGTALPKYYIQMAYHFKNVGQPDSARFYAWKGYHEARRISLYQSMTDAMMNLGVVQQELYENYDSATWYYLQGLAIAEQQQDTALIILLSSSLNYVHYLLRNHEQSISYLRKAMYLSEVSQYKSDLRYIYHELTYSYYSNRQVDSCLYFANKLLGLGHAVQNYLAIKEATKVMGDLHLGADAFDSAIHYYNLSEQAAIQHIAQGNGTKGFLYELYYRRTYVAHVQNDLDQKQYWLEKSAQVIDSGQYAQLITLNEAFAEVAQAQGKHEAAGKYLEAALQYSQKDKKRINALYDSLSLKNAAELDKKYQTAKKQEQILLLENKNQRQAAQNTLLLVLVGVGIFLLVAGVLTYRKIKDKNQQLALASGQLKDSNKTKDKLISMVSHDLRRPMDNLGILLQLMDNQDTRTLLEQNPEFVADVTDEFKTVNTMLRDLLFWVLLQRDNMVYKPQQFLLDTLIAEQISLMNPVVRNKGLHITQYNTGYSIETDRDMLRFILRNLLSNAVQYTPEKGKITIEAALTDHGFNLIVRDSGLGMSEEKLAGLFQVNFNAEALDRSSSGAGVGLSLCADIARRMGAKLYAQSTLGNGSTFILELGKTVVTEGPAQHDTVTVQSKHPVV